MNAGAAVPLKLTADVPVKLVPVMTTASPTSPPVGAKDVIVGVARISRLQPPEMDPASPAVSSYTNRFHAPFGAVPLNTDEGRSVRAGRSGRVLR